MADLLNIGTNSLLNMQQALTTTGHNIANVNTQGYSRQLVKMDSLNPASYGFGYVGQGATIGSVDRVVDGFINTQLNGFTSSQSQYETYATFNNRLNDLVADSNSGMNSSLQNFFNSIQEVAANPAAYAQREVLLGDANNLIYKQQSMNKMLTDLSSDISNQLRVVVDDINNTVTSISKLNQQIMTSVAAAGGASPNDLLDQRDQLIRDLATKVSVSAVEQPDGAVNIFIGKGQALVVGSRTTALEVRSNPYDASKLEVALEDQSAGANISRFITGGELQGLMDFRERSLLPAQDAMGLITLGLTEAINAQHTQGLDLNGNPGTDFFAYSPAAIRAHQNNAGNTVPTMTIQNAADVKASDYRLYYTGAQWELTRMSDNTTVSGTGVLSLDGMDVDVSAGTPVTNDSFVFNPARDASSTFSMVISNAASIAAASAVNLNTPSSNTGTGALTGLAVTDPSFIPLAAPVAISYSADALGVGIPGFLVNGGADGTLAYDPATDSAGKDFTVAGLGISFSMNGVPGEGDSFTVAHNAGGKGDNTNAALLAEIQSGDVVDGSSSTLQEFYGAMVARIGTNGAHAQNSLAVETTLMNQAENYRDSISGVSLDEEASNMIRYQQAYQASAQVVKVANEIFQTLINSIG